MGRPKGIKSEHHGMTGTRPYRIWRKMRERCENQNHKFYKDYGGRGIQVCKEWRSFTRFWEDMKETYSTELTLDRIDTNGNYNKKNCRWATLRAQQRNRRDNRFLEKDGVSKPVWEWVEELKLNRKTIYTRLGKGMTDTEALAPLTK